MITQSAAHRARRKAYLEAHPQPAQKERGRSRAQRRVPQPVHRGRHRGSSTRRLTPPRRPAPILYDPANGTLEEAIQAAHAVGNLRQCLQWILRLQGIHVEWDDPRLDTVTEDDIWYAEITGTGPDATPEERARAEEDWAMRRAEDEEELRRWERTATEAEKRDARLYREAMEARQLEAEARLDFFRAPRKDKPPQRQPQPEPVPKRQRTPPPPLVIPVRPYAVPPSKTSRPSALFPMESDELADSRRLWLEQGHTRLELLEELCHTPIKHEAKRTEPTSFPEPRKLERAGSSDSIAHTSTSTSSSAPSALFSSFATVSTATSVSSTPTVCSPTSSRIIKHRHDNAPPAVVVVPHSDSPLHRHLLIFASEQAEEASPAVASRDALPLEPKSARPRNGLDTRRKSWAGSASSAILGLAAFSSRMHAAYTTLSTDTPFPAPSSDEMYYLLPLRRPYRAPILPPPLKLPRSPHKPLSPPPTPTPRTRVVTNPQFLRIKALHNSLRWGLVVPHNAEECMAVRRVAEGHIQFAGKEGRKDVDMRGRIRMGRECVWNVVVEGAGRSQLAHTFVAEGDAKPDLRQRRWSFW